MSSSHFELVVRVIAADIDEQNHVNNTVYLRWVQDVATAHWRALADRQAQEIIGWIVLRHEIDYKAPATLGDEIGLRTWVGKASRSLSSGSPKSGARAMARSCRKRARSGVPSMRKLAGRRACQPTCASNFPSELTLSIDTIIVLRL